MWVAGCLEPRSPCGELVPLAVVRAHAHHDRWRLEIDQRGRRHLPPPEDYRDLPYYWKSGQYRMEVDKLRQRLRSAKLILGDVRKTGAGFLAEHDPAPIAGSS